MPRLVLTGHKQPVFDVGFSPSDRQVIGAGDDGTIRIWSARRPGLPLRVLRGHRGRVNSAVFSRDGRRLVSAGDDGTVRVWSLPSGPQLVLRGHDGPVQSAAFNPSGGRCGCGTPAAEHRS
jgi:WD40 repeat protein